jgi:hypothetical protein
VLAVATPVFASYSPISEELSPEPVPHDLDALISEYSTLYGLNEARFRAVQKCENPDLVPQSLIVKNGIQENSWGPWQIHLTAWPEISKEQALDLDWSTRWAAQQWANGNARIWSCYRILGFDGT